MHTPVKVIYFVNDVIDLAALDLPAQNIQVYLKPADLNRDSARRPDPRRLVCTQPNPGFDAITLLLDSIDL